MKTGSSGESNCDGTGLLGAGGARSFGAEGDPR